MGEEERERGEGRENRGNTELGYSLRRRGMGGKKRREREKHGLNNKAKRRERGRTNETLT